MADKQISANNERQQHQRRRRRRQPQPPPLPPQQPQQPQVQPPQPPQQPPQPPQQPPVPLPYPGFRFDPYDHELIKYYLEYKINGNDLRSSPIKEVNIYDHHPRKLSEDYQPQGKDDVWYFFTTREKKYMYGNRAARNAGNNGYWRCTGTDKKITDDIDENKVIGLRKHLKYYEGRQSDKNQKKTEWMMHEYQTLVQAESSKAKTEELKRKRHAPTSMRLDTVLCKIYFKKEAARKKPANKKTVKVTDMDAAGNQPESSRKAGQVKKKKAATRNKTPRVNNSAAKDKGKGKGKGKAKVKADEIEMNHSNQDSDYNTSSYDSANSTTETDSYGCYDHLD
ncbi:protein ATAF2-like [Spinacia oleracea]|uniref:Protein ATAF2-like n=1 Tax=Spinacia oleracea TaxID=3562 RepID=A0A9R0IMU5_SPIOL|nr:protein ATAF2-like [Spinacia oleracea]